MQKEITIKYTSGDTATYIAYPPDFVKWERESKKSIAEFSGLTDILMVAYFAMKRESAGKAVKPFDIWTESVIDVDVAKPDPKVTHEEALVDSE
jgi:hypothetical protein